VDDIAIPITEAAGECISEDLMGVNVVYHVEPDALWTQTSLTDVLYELGVSFIRYPGGEIVDQFHWDEAGYGRRDSWNPAVTTSDRAPATDWMSVEEYDTVLDETCGKPMLGVNTASGARFNRIEEGVAQAQAFARYVHEELDRDVDHWFVSNEQHLPNTEGGHAGEGWSPERYARAIERYATALHEVEPDLDIIANYHPVWAEGWRRSSDRRASTSTSWTSTTTGGGGSPRSRTGVAIPS
jgi:alpha-N-arabinofuranosidase